MEKFTKEFFGRGDDEYKKIKKRTLDWLSRISSKDIIVPIPGAATTAAYVCLKIFFPKNFDNKYKFILKDGLN